MRIVTELFDEAEHDAADVEVTFDPKASLDGQVRHENAKLPAPVAYDLPVRNHSSREKHL